MGLAVVDLVEVGDGLKIAVELRGVFKPGVVVAPDQVLVAPAAGTGRPRAPGPAL